MSDRIPASLSGLVRSVPARRRYRPSRRWVTTLAVGLFVRGLGSVQGRSVLGNAWTTNPHQSIITGSFIGEVDVSGADTSELNNRVGQLEREVKGRDNEIRQLTDRVRRERLSFLRHRFLSSSSFELWNRWAPPSLTRFILSARNLTKSAERNKQRQDWSPVFNGIYIPKFDSLQRRGEKREVFACSLQESNLAKLGREVDGLKTDSRDKDLRLQSLQGKVGQKVNRELAQCSSSSSSSSSCLSKVCARHEHLGFLHCSLVSLSLLSFSGNSSSLFSWISFVIEHGPKKIGTPKRKTR